MLENSVQRQRKGALVALSQKEMDDMLNQSKAMQGGADGDDDA
jgi:hypothetical protein